MSFDAPPSRYRSSGPPSAAQRDDSSAGWLAGLTRLVLRHRRLVAAFWLVVTVAGIASVGTITKAFSDQYSVPGREGFQTNQAITRTFHNGGDSAPIVPVLTLPRGTTVDSPGVRAELARIADRIQRAVPRARIASYASTGDRGFVSRDGRATFLLAYPPPEPGSFGQSPRALASVRAALRGVTVGGASVHVTGTEALQSSRGKKGGVGLLGEGLLGGLGALVVLTFVFASLLAFVPIVVAVISIMTSFLAVWALTAVTPVSAIVEFLIALVGLGIAIDYSLLIVTRWREERAHGHGGEEAIVRAMATAGRAVVFSGATVAVGLLGLVVVPVPFLASVGVAGLVIPLASVAVAITLVPVVLSRFGQRLDWPHRRSDERASRAWTRWAQFVVRRRLVAGGAALALLVALLVAATTIHLGAANGNPNTLSQHGDAQRGLVALERSGIGDGVLSPIEVLARDGDAAAKLASSLGTIRGVDGASAPAGRAWRRAGAAIVDVLPRDDSSATVDRVRRAAHRLDAHARVGGIAAQNSDFISAVYGSFPLMLALVAALTFVLLARALRSLVLPLKAVALNVLSVGAAWGVLTLVFQHGYGSSAIWGIPASGSIPSWLPVIVLAFLFGLSTDYEVFILSRMREAYDDTGRTDQAVVTGIARTGRLVTSAALILFLGFVAMAAAPSTQVKMIATGLGAGIILDATIIRALLVPALVTVLGRANWWLPHAAARILRVSPAPAPDPSRA